ncbi:MAG: radical SAM family heme chaperone HemW [Stenotrophobium sp.]
MPASIAEPPLSLYLHFPWCVRKCPYCDFNSHALRGEIPEQEYIDAMVRDLDFELASSPVSRLPSLVSIFMGGGTPSLFSGRAIACVLEETAKRLRFAADIEITLEANPGTVDEAHFKDYRAAGVNRLSIGVQSLNAAHLKALGRIHDPAQAHRAVDIARRAGFDNLNLDLMYALPQQTPAQAEADLRALIALEPEHISYYQLTLEPNTEFAARPPPLPDDDTAWTMHEQSQNLLAAHSYRQYEVSAYAKDGRRSRHNLNYWQFGDYLGIGAGAHGKRTRRGQIERRARHKHPKTYLDSAGTVGAVQEQRAIPAAELPFEFLMNALRLNEGFRIDDYEKGTSCSWNALAPALARARKLGLLDETVAGELRASEFGRRHLNSLLTLFLE